MDSFFTFLRRTFLHPFVSPFLLTFLVAGGVDRNSIALNQSKMPVLVQPLSDLMKLALLLVGFSWILLTNRRLNRRALNPGKVDEYNWNLDIAVVTGGSGGIGGDLVLKLEKLGTTVVVLDIIPLTYKPGPKTHYMKCDITDFEAVQKAQKAITIKCGRPPTVLVANAGVVRGKTLLDASERDLRMTFDVNVLGFLWCIKAFLPAMIEADHGHVLVTSSATAFVTAANAADYSASKAAVTSLIEGLQTELKHRYGNPCVRVSSFFPSVIGTKMFDGIAAPESLVMPILKPNEVAERMLQTLLGAESEMVIMPAFANITPLVRFLPYWMRVAVQDASANSMAHLAVAKTTGG